MPLLRSKVKSRKFVRCWLVSAVIFGPRLSNTAVSSFLSLSQSLPDLVLITARSSSRYNPTSFAKRSCKVLTTNSPMSSHISAPSWLPMVTSKVLSELRFDHARFWWNRRDLRVCLMIVTSRSVILVNCFTYVIVRSKSCSEIEG